MNDDQNPAAPGMGTPAPSAPGVTQDPVMPPPPATPNPGVPGGMPAPSQDPVMPPTPAMPEEEEAPSVPGMPSTPSPSMPGQMPSTPQAPGMGNPAPGAPSEDNTGTGTGMNQ